MNLLEDKGATSVSNFPLISSTASLSIDTSTSPLSSGTTILSNIIRVKEVFVLEAYSNTSFISSSVLVSIWEKANLITFIICHQINLMFVQGLMQPHAHQGVSTHKQQGSVWFLENVRKNMMKRKQRRKVLKKKK